jgi:hypothetical protein
MFRNFERLKIQYPKKYLEKGGHFGNIIVPMTARV